MASSAILYPAVSLVETAFIKQGYPSFKIGEAWKCNDCFESNVCLCPTCRASYVRAVGHISYSDTFERFLHYLTGTSALILAPSAMFLNASLSPAHQLWTQGPAALKITSSLASYLPLSLRASCPLITTIWISLLAVSTALALITMLTGFGVAGFLMAVSGPTAARHWRHFTPSAAALSFLLAILWGFMVVNGVRPAEFALIYAPGTFGVACFLMVLCMRDEEADQEVGKGLRRLDLDGEEKIFI